jgi:hypothetical protein
VSLPISFPDVTLVFDDDLCGHSRTEDSKVVAALETHFSGNYMKIGATGYLVAAPPKSVATAKDLSDKLGITDGVNGAGMILNIAGYYGRLNPNIWDGL